jgi:hypothetical protein
MYCSYSINVQPLRGWDVILIKTIQICDALDVESSMTGSKKLRRSFTFVVFNLAHQSNPREVQLLRGWDVILIKTIQICDALDVESSMTGSKKLRRSFTFVVFNLAHQSNPRGVQLLRSWVFFYSCSINARPLWGRDIRILVTQAP